MITRGRRAGGRTVRNSALTQKLLTVEFFLFYIDMTYVPGQFIPYIFFAPSHKRPFPRWPPKKLVGTITYEPLVGLHSNLVWLFSRYFWSCDYLLRWIHYEQNGCRSHLKKIDMVVVWVIFSHYFLIMMDKAYGWGVLPSIDGYFLHLSSYCILPYKCSIAINPCSLSSLC